MNLTGNQTRGTLEVKGKWSDTYTIKAPKNNSIRETQGSVVLSVPSDFYLLPYDSVVKVHLGNIPLLIVFPV